MIEDRGCIQTDKSTAVRNKMQSPRRPRGVAATRLPRQYRPHFGTFTTIRSQLLFSWPRVRRNPCTCDREHTRVVRQSCALHPAHERWCGGSDIVKVGAFSLPERPCGSKGSPFHPRAARDRSCQCGNHDVPLVSLHAVVARCGGRQL